MITLIRVASTRVNDQCKCWGKFQCNSTDTGLFAEFTSLGALSGLLAGLSATTLAWLLAETIFKFDYQFDISVALTGILGGTLIVVIAGLLGTRSVLAHHPNKTLRGGAA